MPQLNPSPWFSILVFSWLIFLTIVVPKITTRIFTNKFAPQDTQKSKALNWNWPWQ